MFHFLIHTLCWFTGAKRARDVVYRVLSAACEDGDLSIQEAIEAIEDIFRRNALNLYKLNVFNGSINHETTIVGKRVSLSYVEEDVLFVRIIWCDASGQHRCRVSTFFWAHTAIDTMRSIDHLSIVISHGSIKISVSFTRKIRLPVQIFSCLSASYKVIYICIMNFSQHITLPDNSFFFLFLVKKTQPT